MREKTRKRLAAFFLVVGVGLSLLAMYFYFDMRIWENLIKLVKLRRTPGSWV